MSKFTHFENWKQFATFWIICKLWRRNLENTMINEWRDDLSITLFYRKCTFIGDWITSVNCIIKFSKTALRAHRICCPAIEKPPCTLAKDLCPFCYDLCSSLRSFKRWKNHIPRLILNNYKSRLHISWRRLRDAQIGFVTQLILFLNLFLKSNHVPV